MKILLYSANYAPEPTGIGKYSGEMAEWLVANGHEVRVVAAPPYYPSWKVAEGYQWPPYRRERLNGVDVWRAPLWVPAHPTGAKRVLHLLSFAISSIPCMVRNAFWSPDLVLTVAPAIACAPVGWLTARMSGAKAWLHVQDFEVDVAFNMNFLKGQRTKRFAYWLERTIMRRFDVVSSISLKMTERLRAKGVDPQNIELFPNWVDTDGVAPLERPSAYRAELGIPDDHIVLLYSGTWGAKQNLLAIPAAAKALAHRENLTFVVAGDGVMRPEMEAACKDLGNVRLLPLQPKSRLGELLGMADVHLLTQAADAEDLVLPSKLTGMLASGRPVVATGRAATEIATVVSRCGCIADPASLDSFVESIVKLADDPELRRGLGIQARLYAESALAKEAILHRWLARAFTREPSEAARVTAAD